MWQTNVKHVDTGFIELCVFEKILFDVPSFLHLCHTFIPSVDTYYWFQDWDRFINYQYHLKYLLIIQLTLKCTQPSETCRVIFLKVFRSASFVNLRAVFKRLGPSSSLARWMSKLWNAVIAPRVQEAILSRASMNKQPGTGQTASKKYPSQGQQAVVRAALSILLNKAVLHGCPLPRAGM